MTEPNDLVLSDCKYIKLAGKQWPVPFLGPRQQRVVVPALHTIFRHHTTTTKLPNGKSAITIDMSEEVYGLMIDLVHAALTKAHPKLGKEEFLDMPITTQELREALFIISEQTGLTQTQEETPPVGEAVAENQSTGTA